MNGRYQEEVLRRIDLSKLNYEFTNPPLLVSGMAMMYYGLRKSDKDIDFIVSKVDHKELAKKFKKQAVVLEGKHKIGYKDKPLFVDLFGDHGILIYEFEIWDNIMRFGYDELKNGAKGENGLLIISLEKLLFLSCIRGVYKKRYLDDALLIGKFLSEGRYKDYKHTPNSYWKEVK